MKIIIVGGHISPALAVIERLPKGTQILYIGRKHALEGDSAFSLEYQKINSLGIRFVNITTGRLQRKFTRHTLKSLFKLPIGFIQSLIIISGFKPDVIVCFGGYVQIPVAAAAYILNFPVITHEQTRKAGLANKLISPFAKTICISWPESSSYFPSQKTILTGIPLRKEFFTSLRLSGVGAIPSNFKKNGGKIIYITGGSLGAHPINKLIEGSLAKLLEKFYIIHQTGDAKEYGDYDRLEKIKDSLPKNLRDKYKLFKFIDPKDTAGIMNSADLVISRSGMNTVAELMYLEKPCLLIPLPHGQISEQLENARALEKIGLGRILLQEKLTPELLYSQITQFIAKLDEARNKTSLSKKLINYDGAEKLIQIITQTCSQKSPQKE